MAISSLSTSSMVSGVKRRKIWDQSATTDGFFQIATTTLNVAAGSVTFSSIPQGYTHLQIRALARGNRGTYSSDSLMIQFNLDTSTSKYATHRLYGQGSSVPSTVAYTNLGGIICGVITGAGAGSNTFGASVIDILDYTSTNKHKTVRGIGGEDNNSGTNPIEGFVELSSGVWLDTSAINSIKLYSINATALQQYSSFALYGIKG